METIQRREAWNKGRLVGQKLPLKPKEIWAIRIHLQNKHAVRDLAMFNLAIDSKLRGCDLVNLRVRDVTGAEADRLIAELPEHLAAMAEFSLQTGLRRANVTHLEWSQVDLARKLAWVTDDKTKNRKALAVPLSSKAVTILETWRGKHPRWVFPKAGKPVHQTSTKAWVAALKQAGIGDFCWHDLRHTWASWHVQNGTPLHVLQELGGWSSLKMVQRYPADLPTAAEKRSA